MAKTAMKIKQQRKVQYLRYDYVIFYAFSGASALLILY